MDSHHETKEQAMQRLTDAWTYAKRMEQDWNSQRIAIESEIYALVEKELPEKGTYNTTAGMKIATGFNEVWDDALVQQAYEQWPVESVKFPFVVTYKPDGKAISVLRESVPDLYKLLQPALVLKPKKPGFSIPTEK